MGMMILLSLFLAAKHQPTLAHRRFNDSNNNRNANPLS
jgi:hypothetical protein